MRSTKKFASWARGFCFWRRLSSWSERFPVHTLKPSQLPSLNSHPIGWELRTSHAVTTQVLRHQTVTRTSRTKTTGVGQRFPGSQALSLKEVSYQPYPTPAVPTNDRQGLQRPIHRWEHCFSLSMAAMSSITSEQQDKQFQALVKSYHHPIREGSTEDSQELTGSRPSR